MIMFFLSACSGNKSGLYDEMTKIDVFVADVLETLNKKRNVWERWFERLGGFYDKKFGGTDWREKEKEFWEEKMKSLPDV